MDLQTPTHDCVTSYKWKKNTKSGYSSFNWIIRNILAIKLWVFSKIFFTPVPVVSVLEDRHINLCMLCYTPRKLCGGYTVFTLSVCPCVRLSVTFCFLNNSKSHCWIFIKPCKHVHICKTNTLDKKGRARGQFY